jgi:thiamine-phosphate pyrophosphorylase
MIISMFKVLCVTNRKLCGDFLAQIENVASKKPDGIILREKDLTEAEYEELAVKVLSICEKYSVDCILHTYTKVAIKLKADKIHLPLNIMSRLSTNDKKHFRSIGVSCHSIEDIEKACELGADYVTVGHIFKTECKKNLPPKGINFLKEVCKSVSIPIYAIGGINSDNLHEIKNSGAAGACMMSEFMKEEINFNKEKIKFSKKNLLLYAVTDRKNLDFETFYEHIEQALQGGVTLLQLREKNLDFESFVKEAIEVRKLCHRYNVPLIINDNLEVAIKSAADGIHVGQDDLSAEKIREMVPDDFCIGVTAKTVTQAKEAMEAGADYIGVGAVFPSPTKTNAIRITNEVLNEICTSVNIPAVAIGGINEDNAYTLSGSGISGIAVVSAIFSAKDIKAAAINLKKISEGLVQA